MGLDCNKLTNMKYNSLLSVCLMTALLFSCKTSEVEGIEGTTEVTFSLATDGTHHKVKSELAADYIPEVDDFTVEVFKQEGSKDKRLYRDTYPNSKDKAIKLNAGSYYMLAYHGNALGVGFGKEYAYFQAKEPFQISADQRKVAVSATAKLYNVKVAMNYGADLLKDYPDFLITLATDKEGAKGTLSYTKNDAAKEGFIPAGTLTFTLFQDKSQVNATPDENGNIKVTAFRKTITVEPNDFITLTVNTKPAEGKLTVGIEIDKETETVTDNVEINSTYVSTEAPIVTLGDKLASTLEFHEDEDLTGALVSLKSAAGYSHVYLDFTSPYLVSRGLESGLDLMKMDEATKAEMDKLGITTTEMGPDVKVAAVDFSGLSQKVKYEADPFDATFKVRVVDNNGNTVTSAPFIIKIQKLTAQVNVAEANAFARSFRGVTMTVNEGIASKFALQYRTGEGDWTTVKPESIEGNTLNFAKIGGSLLPETAYQFRSIYDNNAAEVSDNVVVTTEAAAQVGNAGFEEWTTETIKISVEAAKDRKLDWYLPYSNNSDSNNSDSWWAVTSKRSIVTNILATTETCVKSFPTVAYSPIEFTQGKISAHVYSVNVGKYNTDLTPNSMFGHDDKTYVGELFIGTADDSGNHSSDGHSFASRPDKFSFKYKYTPVKNEKFYVEILFKDASGNVIFSKVDNDGPSSSSAWATYTCDINWEDIHKKVSSIYISFKSTSSSSPDKINRSTIEVAGNNFTGHFGSSLYIDDIQMIYE